MNKVLLLLVVVLVLACACGFYLMKKNQDEQRRQISLMKRELRWSGEVSAELSELAGSSCPTKMVFLHHSVGRGIMYAGGLQRLLFDRGVFVSGATYGDEIGQETDIPDWPPKFREEMEKILTFKSHPDTYYGDGTRNDIVMFKSCYPNSDIGDESAAGGRTLSAFKDAFESLKPAMMAEKETLFIYLTAPPQIGEKTSPENAARARQFNDWLIGEYLPAYRAEAPADNLVIFDLFGLLAGEDNLLRAEYLTGKERDSHPNEEASRLAARAIADVVEQALARWREAPPGEAS